MEDNGKRRLGSTISFDPNSEKDILRAIDQLNESHKIGEFIAHLLRIALESPEDFDRPDRGASVVKKMIDLGMSPIRYEYLTKMSKKLDALVSRVNEVYNMSYKTYLLAQMGKRIGLEEKSNNQLMAAFILERQISELKKLLGNDFPLFASSKLEETHEKAQEILQYIIESYDGVINEIKAELQKDIEVKFAGSVISQEIGNSDEKSEGQEDELIELIEKEDEPRDIPKLSDDNAARLLQMFGEL